MSNFKVGDRVKCLDGTGYGHIQTGEEAVVEHLSTGYWLVFKDWKEPGCTYNPKHFELAWQPEPGDMIKVRHESTGGKWWEREYRGMVDDVYITLTDDGIYFGYKEAKQIKPDTTITFADGTKVKLSEESYNNMHGEAK